MAIRKMGLLGGLRSKGVKFIWNERIISFEKRNGYIQCVNSNKNGYTLDTLVLAAGSWSRELAAMLALKLPMVAGRGYSFTLENSAFALNHPAILTEGRVAITPFSHQAIRFGGTMEITASNTPPKLQRVQGIIDAVKQFLPAFRIPLPAEKDIWYGYRPCSADGMPYIGRSKTVKNCIVATGHAMLGLSLGPATGKLVSQIANETNMSMDISAFDIQRFG